jgi:hypothetical protein
MTSHVLGEEHLLQHAAEVEGASAQQPVHNPSGADAAKIYPRWSIQQRNVVAAMLRAGRSCGQIAAELQVPVEVVVGRINADVGLRTLRREVERIEVFETDARQQKAADQMTILLPLMELKGQQCKWPVTADKRQVGGFLFCALPTYHTSSYCRFHADLSAGRKA